MHLPNVKQKITNQELCDIFKCSTQGGMRRSLKTKTLVLVTKTYGKQTYINYWENDILYLTGMGLTGDQTLSSQIKLYRNQIVTMLLYTYSKMTHLIHIFMRGLSH